MSGYARMSVRSCICPCSSEVCSFSWSALHPLADAALHNLSRPAAVARPGPRHPRPLAHSGLAVRHRRRGAGDLCGGVGGWFRRGRGGRRLGRSYEESDGFAMVPVAEGPKGTGNGRGEVSWVG